MNISVDGELLLSKQTPSPKRGATLLESGDFAVGWADSRRSADPTFRKTTSWIHPEGKHVLSASLFPKRVSTYSFQCPSPLRSHSHVTNITVNVNLTGDILAA
jgi:hypothetical protein